MASIAPDHNLTSDWPLPAEGVRALVPQDMAAALAAHPLARDCHPHGFGYYPRARGHHMRRGRHYDYLVLYCVEGGGRLWMDDRNWSIAEGDLVVIPRGHAHEYRALRDAPWSIYWMHLDGLSLPDYIAELNDQGPVVRIGLHDRLLREFRDLLALPASGYTRPVLIHAANLCKSLLSYAIVLRHRQTPDGEGLRLEALHHFMQQHLGERLTLNDLAATAGLSRYHFSRRYRDQTGQPPLQAFLHMKVSRACYLLEVSDRSIAEVARDFGYDDPYYFSRLFKKIVGVAPKRYRKRGRSR